jgi:hypothetical protein
MINHIRLPNDREFLAAKRAGMILEYFDNAGVAGKGGTPQWRVDGRWKS